MKAVTQAAVGADATAEPSCSGALRPHATVMTANDRVMMIPGHRFVRMVFM